jgi:hypothetical protein
VFFSGINGSRGVARMWKMMKEVVIQDLIEKMKMMTKHGIWCIQIDRLSIRLIMWKYGGSYMELCVEMA